MTDDVRLEPELRPAEGPVSQTTLQPQDDVDARIIVGGAEAPPPRTSPDPHPAPTLALEKTSDSSERKQLIAQVRTQNEVIRRLQRLLEANGIDYQPVLDNLDEVISLSVTLAPEEDLKALHEKDQRQFMQKVLELLSGGKGTAALPKMEIRFKNLKVTALTSKGSQGVKTVYTFFKECFTGCLNKKMPVDLICDVSGVFKPGRYTLVLGPPGAGKTTLMKTLANKMKGAGTKIAGDVRYNGELGNTNKFVLKKMVGYVDQRDTHLPSLTVRETIKNAYVGMTGGKMGMDSVLTPDQMKEARQSLQGVGGKDEILLKVLGLTVCADTIVGNDMLRGVSGGQRKRVTLGEMIVGNFHCLFLDEISTGLDSAAALDITRAIRNAVDVFQFNAVVSLLQPAPEIYELFDDILLMDHGHIVYHGPRENILPYFESMGFQCPPRKDVADFLQEVTTKDNEQFLMPQEVRTARGIGAAPTGAADFAARWKQSEIFKTMHEQIDAPWAEYAQPIELRSEFALSYPASVRLCLGIFFSLLKRDVKSVRAAIGQNLVLGTVVGIVFGGLEKDQVQSKLGLIFMTLMNFGMASMSLLPDLFDQRAVFYKQRDACFYPTFAYNIASLLANFPIAVVRVLIFSSIIYWAAGMSGDAGGTHFFFFILLCLVMDQAMAQYFKVLVATIPEYAMATPIAAVTVLFMVLFSGFIIAPEEIPDYWAWFYFINPVAYGFNSLMHNELKSDTYSESTPNGDMYLESFGFKTDSHWKWTGVFFLAGFFVVMFVLQTFLLHNIRYQPVVSGGGVDDEEKAEEPITLQRVNSAIAFSPCSLAWTHLSYAVDLPKAMGQSKAETLELLHDISGFCMPSTMTALMGSSGAGKTTLLDVLAGRKTAGHIMGEFFMNGHPLDRLSFSRITGYVEQTDIHSPASTITEALRFSARLRLPKEVRDAKVQDIVKQTVDMLELAAIKDAQVGGLSVEQAKRVTIGVELVANPAVIFLDEPTSGLDARAAMLIVRVIKKLSASGRTVICTIHQPSSSIFESFDRLLLLKRGGRTVFFGDLGTGSQNLIEYMQSIPGTVPIKPGANPAAWMLDVMGAGTSSSGVADFAHHYETSWLRTKAERELATSGMTSPGEREKITFDEVYAAAWGTMVRENMVKTFQTYWRTPAYNATRLIIGSVVAFLFGTVYWQQEYNDFAKANSRIGVVYMTVFFMGIISTMSVLPVMGSERAVFYRERAANMYKTRAYGIAVGVAEVPYLILVNFIFMNIFYWTVGLRDDVGAYLYYYLFFQLYVTQATFFGQFCVCLLPNQQIAQLVAVLVANLSGIFAGFMQPPQDIPTGLVFFYWINPLTYVFRGLVVSQFKDDDERFPVITRAVVKTMTMEEFIFNERFPDYEYSDRFYCIGVLFGFVALWRIGTMLSLEFINHLKR